MTPVYAVRHAKAGNRARWTEPDHLRPLTKPGWRQARALVELFAGQPFSRLISSPHIRCVQTLEPLAAARAMSVEIADELAEGAAVDVAMQLMVAAAADGPIAVCTHGDVVQLSVRKLAASDIPLRNGSPFDVAKGSTWIFDVAGGAFVGARYVPPPDA